MELVSRYTFKSQAHSNVFAAEACFSSIPLYDVGTITNYIHRVRNRNLFLSETMNMQVLT